MLDGILRHWHLKLLALGLAIVVWVAVTGEGRSVQDFRVPVDIALSPGATLSGTPQRTVSVRLRGQDSMLRHIDPYDLTVRVDLRDDAVGERTVVLSPRNVSGVPHDVEVALIDPDRLRVAIARTKRREIPVVATVVGKPARGYHLYRAVARPEALLVEGPETKIAALTRLATDPIHVDSRSEPFTARVGALPEGAEFKVVDPRPLDVNVYIDLAPVTVTVDRVPIIAAEGADSMTITPSSVAVTLSAPSALIPKLRAGHVRAVAGLNGSSGQAFIQNVPLRVEFPGLDAEERAKVTIESLSKKTVDVRRSAR